MNTSEMVWPKSLWKLNLWLASKMLNVVNGLCLMIWMEGVEKLELATLIFLVIHQLKIYRKYEPSPLAEKLLFGEVCNNKSLPLAISNETEFCCLTD